MTGLETIWKPADRDFEAARVGERQLEFEWKEGAMTKPAGSVMTPRPGTPAPPWLDDPTPQWRCPQCGRCLGDGSDYLGELFTAEELSRIGSLTPEEIAA